MPEYDPVNYPAPMADDLTDGEVGRDPLPPTPDGSDTLSAWPSSNLVPDPYAGPPPAREYETSPLGGNRRGRPVPAVPPPPDAPAPEKSIAPPPGAKQG